MKKYIALIGLLVAAFIYLVSFTGCTTTSTVANGVTNVVTTIDPNRLNQIKAALEPAAASVLRRAIQNSPQHAAEISAYARELGTVFCQMQANNNFDPTYLLKAADDLTSKYQASLGPDVLDGKNAALALYQICFADKLTVQLPNNLWMRAVCGLFCDSINQALTDAGQLGIK